MIGRFQGLQLRGFGSFDIESHMGIERFLRLAAQEREARYMRRALGVDFVAPRFGQELLGQQIEVVAQAGLVGREQFFILFVADQFLVGGEFVLHPLALLFDPAFRTALDVQITGQQVRVGVDADVHERLPELVQGDNAGQAVFMNDADAVRLLVRDVQSDPSHQH